MKLTNVNFLAKANAKINKNEKGIKIVSALLVISITLISAFSITVTKAVNEYKEDYRARTLQVDPILVRLMRIQLIKSEIQNMLKVSFRLKESEMIRSV